MARRWSKLFPISRRSESVKIQEGMTIQHCMGDANNALQTEQSFFVEFVSTQQIGVIAEIAQEPAQPPKGFGCAVDPPSQEMAAVFFGLKYGESHEVERPGGMPTMVSSIYTDEKGTFKLIGAISAFAMQPRNVAIHELTSCGVA
jgi:hypothetical protein